MRTLLTILFTLGAQTALAQTVSTTPTDQELQDAANICSHHFASGRLADGYAAGWEHCAKINAERQRRAAAQATADQQSTLAVANRIGQ